MVDLKCNKKAKTNEHNWLVKMKSIMCNTIININSGQIKESKVETYFLALNFKKSNKIVWTSEINIKHGLPPRTVF